jgi:GTP-binding protein LepA
MRALATTAAALCAPSTSGRQQAQHAAVAPCRLRARQQPFLGEASALRQGPSGSGRRQQRAAAVNVAEQQQAAPPPRKQQGSGPKVVKVPPERVRNFSIIAHIDHGKSTLADQLLIKTDTVEDREMQAQYLDGMDLERERGITIKLNTARMKYVANDGQTYALNLIDTPGHVDFSYEVSRSLAACEGCLLVVDASQGVEAQTLANVYLALENDLEIIPVLNKIDLPGADPERVKREIEEVIGLDCSNAIMASAKQGIGIQEILEAVVERIPPPKDARGEPLRALIFDSYYDAYKGVIVQFRVMDGELRRGELVKFMNTGCEYDVTELGVLSPKSVEVQSLYAGEVGYLAASIKQVADARVGDTITLKKQPAAEALPGYTEAMPMVFCGLFPTDADQYPELRDALLKLQLNDAALKFEPEVSSAMGFGFRCGFLGLLHMEIVQERLEREYDLDLITTAPTVVFKAIDTAGNEHIVDCPSKLPPGNKLDSISEPYVRLEIITPKDYVGAIMELAQQRRGEYVDMQYLTETRTTLVYNMPLAEVVTDFFDALKSRSRGYASMEYSLTGYRENDLVLLDVKINAETVEPLAAIVHRDNAYYVGKALVKKLKELIPRQQFRVPIQAAIGSRVVASESIPALRKDVLAKCYGGDISRKKKLLKKQAAGKKRMKSLGRVDVPQEAFMAVLSINQATTSTDD